MPSPNPRLNLPDDPPATGFLLSHPNAFAPSSKTSTEANDWYGWRVSPGVSLVMCIKRNWTGSKPTTSAISSIMFSQDHLVSCWMWLREGPGRGAFVRYAHHSDRQCGTCDVY